MWDGILLNQKKYDVELISDTGLSGARTTSTSLEQIIKLTTIDYDTHAGRSDDLPLEDISSY